MTGAQAIAAALVIIAFLAGPIGTAIGRRIAGSNRGKGAGDEADVARLRELEQRLQDVEAAQARIVELEERLDFAERMLAQPGSDRDKALPGSAHG